MNAPKPLTSVQLALQAMALVKTAAVVVTMMLLEWARLRERRAQLDAAGARADAEVLKAKLEASHDTRPAAEVVDGFLRERGARPPGGAG